MYWLHSLVTKKEEEEEYDHEEDEHLAGKAWQLPFKIDVKGVLGHYSFDRYCIFNSYSIVPKVPVPVPS